MLGACPRAEAAEVLPVDGPPLVAELVSVDANWQVGLKAAEGSRQMPAADLVRWGAPQELRRGPVVVFANGDFLVVDALEADKQTLTAETLLFGRLQIPLERLAGVLFQLPAGRPQRDRLLDVFAGATGNSDAIILRNDDRVTGRFQGIGQTTVQLTTTVGPVDVERLRIRALVFNPSLLGHEPVAGPRALVGFSDGSRLTARKLELRGPSVKLSAFEGLTWNAAAEELVYLQPLGGRVAYLSDLKAADYRYVPFLELSWPYRTDRSVTGGWFRAGGRIYPKGLGLHSASRLTYQLGQAYRRLDAQLAVDDTSDGRGSVRFRVFVDGVLKYTSPTIRGATAPVPISVDLEGAKRLDLVVDFADRADVLDRADLLEARLVR